ncbi:hypothetical protein Dsin_032185 [Dipteronia sinensis]|uniref:Uncharacterized protein n=1 Tax=Dipteronia sinensis TaxID=43782 RepID=A0AAD9ZP80_9ROSI|nr:hypothetical protein Dsin_032185 [Dipteronia sinensis]
MEENDFSKLEMSLNQIESSYDLTITDLGREETVKSDSIFHSEVLFDLKSDVSSSLEAATDEKDCVNLDLTFKISPRTSCPPLGPMLAPIDANPLMPPYDPKTNYLSPMPQFLYYRPNMRIKYMLHKDSESFASKNSSDSEVIEILSKGSQEESEDISSEEENGPEFEKVVHDNITEVSEHHIDSQSDKGLTSFAHVIKLDNSEAQHTQEIVEYDVEIDIKLQSNNIDLEGTENQPDVVIPEGSQNINDLTKNFVGISLSMLLSLLVKIAFFTYANAKKGKSSTPISVSAEHAQTKVEVGEPCPSEMSSFKSMSSRNR